ncbi:MAG: metalloregulator ArsR/SmtB family transcription factor [Ruminococcus sp.]|nr:metalloregulator ArsR/SmtB family transcription factor [Ruminococcus sp.]
MSENTIQNKHLECQGKNIEKIKKIQEDLLGFEEAYDLSELFKVLGDATRLRILFTLLQSEMCVCDIVELLDVTQSAVSHQLRVLKQARLVKYRREGKSVIYSIADDHVKTIIAMAIEHVSE